VVSKSSTSLLPNATSDSNRPKQMGINKRLRGGGIFLRKTLRDAMLPMIELRRLYPVSRNPLRAEHFYVAAEFTQWVGWSR
jgi:hypothetical protein